MNDGSMNEPPANPAAGERTLIQSNYFGSVSHSADGGRSSASQLVAGKTQPVNPPPALINQPVADNVGGDAQGPQPPAAANQGRYRVLTFIISYCNVM